MNKYGEMAKAFRSVTAWGCFVVLMVWMVVDVDHISVPVLLALAVFFLFSFNASIDRDGAEDEGKE